MRTIHQNAQIYPQVDRSHVCKAKYSQLIFKMYIQDESRRAETAFKNWMLLVRSVMPQCHGAIQCYCSEFQM